MSQHLQQHCTLITSGAAKHLPTPALQTGWVGQAALTSPSPQCLHGLNGDRKAAQGSKGEDLIEKRTQRQREPGADVDFCGKQMQCMASHMIRETTKIKKHFEVLGGKTKDHKTMSH